MTGILDRKLWAQRLHALAVFLTLSTWISGLIVRESPHGWAAARAAAGQAAAAGLPSPPSPPPVLAAPTCSTYPPFPPVNLWWILDLVLLPNYPLFAIGCFTFKARGAGGRGSEASLLGGPAACAFCCSETQGASRHAAPRLAACWAHAASKRAPLLASP